MASSTLESQAAFVARARDIGVEVASIQRLVDAGFGSYGRFAFAVPYAPQHPDDRPFQDFLQGLLRAAPTESQLSALRRLFFESHTMALADVRARVESSPDQSLTARKLPTAERLARQTTQQGRLTGIIFTPDTTPANHLVDAFVDMVETGLITYVKAEQCCSRAQEVSSLKRDTAIALDSNGLLKLGKKSAEGTCEANTELKLRAAWQRRSLAMDLAGISSFEVVEQWIQTLFSHLMREQPKGFSKVTLQQLLDCDKHLFTLASHRTMGRLTAAAGDPKPLDAAIGALRESQEVLQYLTPLPAGKRAADPPANDPPKKQKVNINKESEVKGQHKQKTTGISIPEGCVTHDDNNKPLCFKFQQGKCSFKGPAGKRCAKGFHKCYKAGCFRNKPYHLCTHSD